MPHHEICFVDEILKRSYPPIFENKLVRVIGKMLKMAGKLKQATISSLKGVVVIEELLRHKAVLEHPDHDEQILFDTIAKLAKKKPCKEVISSTGIGHTLKNLQNKCSDKLDLEIQKLCDYWDLYSENKYQPTIEVRYDKYTTQMRATSLRYFKKELGLKEHEQIADFLEKEIFFKCNRLISKSYKRTVRKIIFVLRNNKKEKEDLIDGLISPINFIKRYQR